MENYAFFCIFFTILFIVKTDGTLFPHAYPQLRYYTDKNFSAIDNSKKTLNEKKHLRLETRILVRRSTSNLQSINSINNNTTAIPLSDKQCNSEKLQRIMQENMYGDYRDMKMRIMSYAEKSIGGLFSVICAPGDFSYVTTTRLYCLHTIGDNNCLAFLTEQNETEGIKGK